MAFRVFGLKHSDLFAFRSWRRPLAAGFLFLSAALPSFAAGISITWTDGKVYTFTPAPSPSVAPSPVAAEVPSATPAPPPASSIQYDSQNCFQDSNGIWRTVNLGTQKRAYVGIILPSPVKDGQTVRFSWEMTTNMTPAEYRDVNWKFFRVGDVNMSYGTLTNIWGGHTPGAGADQITAERSGYDAYAPGSKAGNGTLGYFGNPIAADRAGSYSLTIFKNGASSSITYTAPGISKTWTGVDLSNCVLQRFLAQAVAESGYSIRSDAYAQFQGLSVTVK